MDSLHSFLSSVSFCSQIKSLLRLLLCLWKRIQSGIRCKNTKKESK